MNNVFSLQLMISLSCIFTVAAFIKGLSGFGMPLIAVPATILLTGVPATTAMGWALGPIFVTNLMQIALVRSDLKVIARVWPLFGGLILSLFISVQFLGYFDTNDMTLIVGIMILVLVLSQLLRPWTIPIRWQRLFLVASGAISGLIGGLTTFFGFPAIQSILAVGVNKDEFVCTVSLMFLIGGLVIGSALGTHGLMSAYDFMLSVGCILPAVAGLSLGQKARNRLPVETFKHVVFVILLVTGSSMVLNSF